MEWIFDLLAPLSGLIVLVALVFVLLIVALFSSLLIAKFDKPKAR